MPVSAIVTLGFAPPGNVNLIPTLGYSIGAAPVVEIGSLRVAAVESRPGLRIRDMVVPSIAVAGLETDSAGISIGSVEIIP